MPKKQVERKNKGDIDLYQPEKYRVHLGRGSVGFCTVWNEAAAAIKLAPQLTEQAAIIGTLYSGYGVNIILRNLALNPQIKKLYLWGNGTLSNTKFGVMGSSILKKIWSDGVEKGNVVSGTSFKLEKEIDRDILKEIIAHVDLVDVSRLDLVKAVKAIQNQTTEPYMVPVRFAETKLEEPDTYPSEQVGWLVRGRGIVETWTRVVERIMRYGTVKGTQYGNQQKELTGVTWVVHNENPADPILPTEWPKELCEVTGATKEAIDEYHAVFLSPKKPKGVSYTYGNRLMRYPLADGKTIDQIKQSVIRNLKDSPDSRRAVATTLVPWIDALSSEPPCITQVQFLQAKGKLNMLVTVRSHDIFKAAIPNAFGLRLLQQRVATETGFEMGALQITSQSAHIYESDWDNARKLVRCAIWERPARKWVQGEDADPRGAFLVRLQEGKIHVEFQAGGQTLLEFSGKSADKLALEISKHELISQTYHALDIGIQLARAEVALKEGVEFVQDRPLK